MLPATLSLDRVLPATSPPQRRRCLERDFPICGHKRTFPFTMVGRDGARSEKPRRSRASLPDHPSRVMRIGGACCVRGTAPGAIPLAVWCPEGAWGGFASLIVADWPCSSHEQGLCCRG